MSRRKLYSFIILTLCTVSGCISPQTPTSTTTAISSPPTSPPTTTPVSGGVSEPEARAAAIAYVPASVLAKASFEQSLDQGSYWAIRLSLNPPVTKEELTWIEKPGILLENHGLLPKDIFGILLIQVDKQTSQVISRLASDSVFLGPIPTTPPPPPPITSNPPLQVISIEFVGPTNPGEPIIELTLKNVSDKAIASLYVNLFESEPKLGSPYVFAFGVNQSTPLLPSTIVNARKTLIGAGWGKGIPYHLNLTGTFQNGEVFHIQWNPPVEGDYKSFA